MEFESAKKHFIKGAGERLLAKRMDHNFSIEKVAMDIGIEPDILQQIENGLYDVDLLLFLDLCKYYNVRVHDLLDNF